MGMIYDAAWFREREKSADSLLDEGVIKSGFPVSGDDEQMTNAKGRMSKEIRMTKPESASFHVTRLLSVWTAKKRCHRLRHSSFSPVRHHF